MSRNVWIAVMIALGLGLALRLTAPDQVSDLRPRADALEYDLASGALARGEGYVLPLEEHAYPPRYTIGYPLLVAGARILFDELHAPGFGVVVSVLAGLLVILCGALLAYELGGDRAAIAAALLLALSPLQIFHARQPMSDAAALALLFASLALGLRWARSSQLHPRQAWAFGFLVAFGATVRITNALAAPFLLLLVLTRPFGDRAQRARTAISFLVGCAVGITPQLAVNLRQHGNLLRSGYSYWIPSVYGAGEARDARALLESLGLGGANFGAYATQVAGWDALQRDAQRLGLADAPPAAAPAERGRSGEDLLLDRSLEPPVLYPFPIALLALLGLGMRGRGGNVARSQRAIGLLLPVAIALYLFYGAYSYRELRFLLPLQALLVVFASRAFASSRKTLRPATYALAGLALLSAAADIAAASRPMQSTAPYGRANEETLALRWISRSIEANAIVAVRTHTALVERELLFHQTDRRWVPIGRDEHRLRIDALGLEAKARPRKDLDGAQRAFFEQYRPHAIDLDQTVIDLMQLRAEVLAGRPLDDGVRAAALALLLRLPPDALGDEARSTFAGVLARTELAPAELGLAVFFLARCAVLESFAHGLERFGALLEQMPERPAYLSDLYLFEYVLEEPELRQMLQTGEVAMYAPDGTRRTRALAPPWKGLELAGEWPRPGFAPQASGGRFALYRVKRG